MIGESDLELVISLLLVLPGLFTLALLAGQTLVLVCDLLLVGGLSLGVLVLEHGAHAEVSLLLLGPLSLLLS